MSTPNRPPISTPRRDPVRCARGKEVVKTVGDPAALTKEQVEDAIYYLDGVLFVGAGLGRGAKLLRAEAKKRGVL